jgi:Raf kinase inhibitor-like YbhB/YbcL family protein
MEIRSTAFENGAAIPDRHAKEKGNTSPALEFGDVPAHAHSLALLVEDPDAPSGLFCHWVIYDMPPEIGGLEEGVPPSEVLHDGSVQGQNDFGDIGYGGPRPPSGTHRYFFRLFALDKTLDLQGTVKRQDLRDAMEGHVLAECELMGTYAKA